MAWGARRVAAALAPERIAGVPAWATFLGDDVGALAASWRGLDRWVERVGVAFEAADNGRGGLGVIGPVALARYADDATIADGAGSGPTWVDALTDDEAEAALFAAADGVRRAGPFFRGTKRAAMRARLWPLWERVRDRWPAAAIRSVRPAGECAAGYRIPAGLDAALDLIALPGPGRAPRTAGLTEGFLAGFIEGDADERGYENLGGEVARTAGHVTSGLAVFGDARDVAVNVTRRDWGDAALAGVGFIPAFGDAAKGGKAAGKAIDAIDAVRSVRRIHADDLYDLARHDTWGGHAGLKHVGLTDAQLAQRLVDEPRIPAASTFLNHATASKAIRTILEESAADIDTWLAGGKPHLIVDHRFTRTIGRVQSRGSADVANGHLVRAVLKREPTAPNGWHILTMKVSP